MKRTRTRKPPSALAIIHQTFGALHKRFRDIVCLECNWSAPTYYRKMRQPKLLSNAELEKIGVVKDYVLKEVAGELKVLTYSIPRKK